MTKVSQLFQKCGRAVVGDEIWDETWFQIGAEITGTITFVVVWAYAFVSWGFLIGLTIGWLPAIIGGMIAGFLWPLLLMVGGLILLKTL